MKLSSPVSKYYIKNWINQLVARLGIESPIQATLIKKNLTFVEDGTEIWKRRMLKAPGNIRNLPDEIIEQNVRDYGECLDGWGDLLRIPVNSKIATGKTPEELREIQKENCQDSLKLTGLIHYRPIGDANYA